MQSPANSADPLLAHAARAALGLALVVVTWLTTADISEVALDESVNDKLGHLLAFLVLGGLAGAGFPRRAPGGIAAALVLYGLALEAIQYYLPYRDFSLLDWAADCAGVALGLLLARPLRRHPAG